jgi:hypothetical protein
LAGATALVASLIVGPAANAKSERQSAGTIVIGHDQEPVTLNNFITEGNAYTTSLVTNTILAGGQIYNEKAVLAPYLFAGKPTIRRTAHRQFRTAPGCVGDGKRSPGPTSRPRTARS